MAHKEPRNDVRVYLKPEEHQHLKAVAKEQDISLSELIRKTVMKKYALPKKKKARQPDALQGAEKSKADNCLATEQNTKQMEARLVEVNTAINKAHKGERLPSDEYRKLKAEQTELKKILGHN